MSPTTQDIPHTPEFEFPNPPDKFGQDGHFYRCYDALAQKIDDDMVNGLKEQLNMMLVFVSHPFDFHMDLHSTILHTIQAGLFAAVNTAFLSISMPRLFPDPADDTNALLVQNNMFLMLLVTGRNETTWLPDPVLPSTTFRPSFEIVLVNMCSVTSLTLAIASSLLVMICWQWLVYYRRHGERRSELHRWEQLKRFLGARRWQLEPICHYVIPYLLQLGLFIFLLSLVVYMHYLDPTLSFAVGWALGVVAGSFILGTWLFTFWDRFCPFRSALLDSILGWLIISLRFAVFLGGAFLGCDLSKRKEEGPETLKALALRRTICGSDDPESYHIKHHCARRARCDEPIVGAVRFSAAILGVI